MKRFSRFLALLISMVMIMSLTVYADEPALAEGVIASEEITETSDARAIEENTEGSFAINELEINSEDVKEAIETNEEDVNLNEKEDLTSDETTSVSDAENTNKAETEENDKAVSEEIKEKEELVPEETEENPMNVAAPDYITVKKVSTSKIEIILKYTKNGSLHYGIWSDANGQDDIGWYNMEKESDGAYHSIISLNDFRDKGDFSADFYDGDKYVGNLRFNSSSYEAESEGPVVVEQVTANEFDIILKMYSGKFLHFAIWSEANGQDDIKWYNMEKESDGAYHCKVNIKDFKNIGRFIFDIYDENTFVRTDDFDTADFGISTDNFMSVIKKSADVIQIVVSNVQASQIGIWSDAKGQDDIKWYNLIKDGDSFVYDINLNNFNDRGKFTVHIYNKGVYVGEGKFDTENLLSTASKEFKATNKGGSKYDLCLKEFKNTYLHFAIWSEEKGQNDLKWINMEKGSDGAYHSLVDIAKFSGPGKYIVDMYEYDQFVGTFTFTAKLSDASVYYDGVSQKKGYAKLHASGVPEGVSKVRFKVWSKDDKSDLYTYTGALQEDGTYLAAMYKYRHQDNVGDYKVEVWVTYPFGSSKLFGTTSYTLNPAPATEFTMTRDNDGQFSFSLDYIEHASYYKSVRFVIWSSKNQDDDATWYDTTYKKSTTRATATINVVKQDGYGSYCVEAYGYDEYGKGTLLAAKTFDASAPKPPSCGEVNIIKDIEDGTAVITIKDVKCEAGLDKVYLKVWSKDDKSDVFYYYPNKDKNGNYVTVFDIKNHGGNLGVYHVSVKVRDVNKVTEIVASKKITMEGSKGKLVAVKGSNGYTYDLILSGLVVPGGLAYVQAAVWSGKDGQDDLKWTYMEENDYGEYVYHVNMYDHKGDEGVYYAHVYAYDKNGNGWLVGNTEFEVIGAIDGNVTLSGLDDGDGEFSAKVNITKGKNAISSVKVRVFCADDESDVYWYAPAGNTTDGFTAKINIANHKGNCGLYKIYAYGITNDGDQVPISSTAVRFEPEHYLLVSDAMGTYTRTIAFKTLQQGKVEFVVWSDRGGYSANGTPLDKNTYYPSYLGDGMYKAEMSIDQFNNDGRYFVQAWLDGKPQDTASFIMIDYIEEAVKMCYDDSIGYSQVRRNLNPDVDCSSFVYYALKNSGAYNLTGGAFSTYNEERVLTAVGFSVMNYTGIQNLQPGDILLRNGHTEIYIGNGLTAGAHQDEVGDIVGAKTGDQTGREVCVANVIDYWEQVLRDNKYRF